MKKVIFLITFLLLGCSIFSQPWERYLPREKAKNETLTFYDYQQAFYDYWKPYHVDRNGYYFKNGEKHNLILMVNDIAEMWKKMEDLLILYDVKTMY